jgi:hypothetical protein
MYKQYDFILNAVIIDHRKRHLRKMLWIDEITRRKKVDRHECYTETYQSVQTN